MRCENLRKERDILKQVENRLNQEKESILAEQRGQNLLLANLKSIQVLQRSQVYTQCHCVLYKAPLWHKIITMHNKTWLHHISWSLLLMWWTSSLYLIRRQTSSCLFTHKPRWQEADALEWWLHKCETAEYNEVISNDDAEISNRLRIKSLTTY